MEFYFLGTGNAFGHGGRRRSHYFWMGSENWLIDASYDALAGLRSINKDSCDIDKIFISHLHPDHYMAIPQFALEDYYVLKKSEPIDIIGPLDLKDTITKATRLFFNDEVVDHLDHLFTFHEIPENETMAFDNGKLETLPADHTGNARMQIIEMDGVSLGYTGDTGFQPLLFDQLLESDLIITEASSASHLIPHHTTLEQILGHKIPSEKIVYISHVGETTLEDQHKISPPLYLAEDGMMITL